MSGERTIPLLPCADIDDIGGFYGCLGFEVTYRQLRPNPYLVVKRGGIELHFFGLPEFDPEESYGSCVVYVDDTGEVYRAFAEGMRGAFGKLVVSGIPRMTRPRKRKNTDNLSGFTIVDPGGNWIRIFEHPNRGGQPQPSITPASKLADALQTAIVLGESKGDHAQAARILDSTLARHGLSASPTDRVEALVYRAELAVVLSDGQRAHELLAEVRDIPLREEEQARVADALEGARELERVRDPASPTTRS